MIRLPQSIKKFGDELYQQQHSGQVLQKLKVCIFISFYFDYFHKDFSVKYNFFFTENSKIWDCSHWVLMDQS